MNDLWEDIGSLPEDELLHVITSLFAGYEKQLKHRPGDQEALHFFRNLDNAISQSTNCNLNRR
jgi:hypothetical protein